MVAWCSRLKFYYCVSLFLAQISKFSPQMHINTCKYCTHIRSFIGNCNSRRSLQIFENMLIYIKLFSQWVVNVCERVCVWIGSKLKYDDSNCQQYTYSKPVCCMELSTVCGLFTFGLVNRVPFHFGTQNQPPLSGILMSILDDETTHTHIKQSGSWSYLVEVQHQLSTHV